MRVVKHWQWLPRNVIAFPLLEICKPDWTWPWATCCDWPCWELGWRSDCTISRGPFQSQPSWDMVIVWCLNMLDRHPFLLFIPIKLQNYYVQNFPVQGLLSLTAGSGEKWDGERAFLWAMATGRHNDPDTGYRVLWERQYTVSITSEKLSHTQECKEKLLREVSNVIGSCCKVSHNCSNAFYQGINPCRILS